MRLLGTSSDPEFLRTLGIVSGGHLLSHLYVLAYPPLFPLLIDDFGLNNTQLGLIMSVVALSMFLFQTPVGELVDRIGAKPVFVLGLVFTGGGTALVGAATSYPLLLVFALVAGIGQSAFHPADYTLLDAVTEGDQEGRSFGIHTFAGYAGFAVAPALVGGLGVLYGWQIALFVVLAAAITLATGAPGVALIAHGTGLVLGLVAARIRLLDDRQP
jgi:MFS family permease